MKAKRKVIVVTDGDRVAQKAVSVAAENIGARVISRSAGHPTPVTGRELAELVKQAPRDPVIVMVDDDGTSREGLGQKALIDLAKDPEIDIIGAVAVASYTPNVRGTRVDESVTSAGVVIQGAVDKEGNPNGLLGVSGDTVDALNQLDIPFVVGLGDPGKMDFQDDALKGAPVTTKALREVLDRAKVR